MTPVSTRDAPAPPQGVFAVSLIAALLQFLDVRRLRRATP